MSWLDDDLSTTLDSSIANMNSTELLKAKKKSGSTFISLLRLPTEHYFLEGSYPSPVCPSDKISI